MTAPENPAPAIPTWAISSHLRRSPCALYRACAPPGRRSDRVRQVLEQPLAERPVALDRHLAAHRGRLGAPTAEAGGHAEGHRHGEGRWAGQRLDDRGPVADLDVDRSSRAAGELDANLGAGRRTGFLADEVAHRGCDLVERHLGGRTRVAARLADRITD